MCTHAPVPVGRRSHRSPTDEISSLLRRVSLQSRRHVGTGEILKIRLRFVSYSFCILFLYYGIIEYGFVQLPNCHDQFPEFRDFYRRHAILYFEEISQLEDRGNRISCLVTIDSSTLIDRSKTFYISCCSISLNRNRLAYTRTHTYTYTYTRIHGV